jgi:hypothetical protein
MDANPKFALLKILSNSSLSPPSPGSGRHFIDSFGSFEFSPDDRQILFAKNNYGNQGSMIHILDLETMKYIDDFIQNITPDFQEQRIGDIYWFP